MLLLKKSFQLFTGALFITGLLNTSSAQFAFIEESQGYLLEKNGWKWSYTQSWDQESTDWDDTSSLLYVVANNDGLPTEMYQKIKDSNGLWQTTAKITSTFSGNKVISSNYFIYNADSNKYSDHGATVAYSWTDTLLTKITAEISVVALLSADTSMQDISLFLPMIQNAKLINEINFTFNNNKIVTDSSRAKITGINPFVWAIAKSYIDSLGYSIDTSWTNNGKNTYSYNNTYNLCINYAWNTTSKIWQLKSKDSLQLLNNKLITCYSSSYDTLDASWRVNSKELYTYNTTGDLIERIIMNANGNGWQNVSKNSYIYSLYPSSAKKQHQSEPSGIKIESIIASAQKPFLNLHLAKPSLVSIEITDLKGRILERSTWVQFPGGSVSIPLRPLALGYFMCKVSTEGSNALVPIRILK